MNSGHQHSHHLANLRLDGHASLVRLEQLLHSILQQVNTVKELEI